MIHQLANLPSWIKYSLGAILCIFLGFSFREVVEIVNLQQDKIAISLLVKSEATKKPVLDAEVTLQQSKSPRTLRTDSNGYVETEVTDLKTLHVEVSKEGYITKEQSFDLSTSPPFVIFLAIDQLAPNCFGDSCTDRIPPAAKCDSDATTANYATGEEFSRGENLPATLVLVEIRFSKKCNSYWARATSPTNYVLYLQDDRGSRYMPFEIPKVDIYQHYTEMVSADLRVRACLKKLNSPGSKPTTTCTGFVDPGEPR